MGEAYNPLDADSRTFGDLIQRVLLDLHRPDLLQLAPDYIRDAIRYYSRMPFFFNQIDNTNIGGWQASLYYPQGTTIIETASDLNQYIFVALTAGTNGSTIPVFTPTIFQPNGVPGINFAPGDPGVTQDGTIYWATVQQWTPSTDGATNFFWTQLSTVPTFNQYVGPLDYVAPYRVEITIPNLRFSLTKQSYDDLRNWDVIRPSPTTAYPTDWAWFQNQIYIWPYPVSFYPLTLSYYTAPPVPVNMTDSNFWTTTAESLIRAYTRARINAEVLRDVEAAQADQAVAKLEFDALKLEEVAQNQTGNIPPDYW